MKTHLRALACACLIAVVSQTAGAALVSRLGGRAVYDADQNIIWTADANLAATHTFGVSGINTNGSMTWKTANSWIAAMNADGGKGYLGFNDWRLPTTTYRSTANSEMSRLALTDFNAPYYGSVLHNGDPRELARFTNIQPGAYWSGEWIFSYYAWDFNFNVSGGDRGLYIAEKTANIFTWAVRSGDVPAAVPLPAAVWLFGSGLIGLLGLARRQS